MILHLLLVSAALGAAAGSSEDRCFWAGPRVDCGFPGIGQDACEAKGCCWLPASFKGSPTPDLPWCFKNNNGPSEYTLKEEPQPGNGRLLEGSLQLSKATQKELGPDIEAAQVSIEAVSDSILRVRITDAERERWEIPTFLYKSDVLQGTARPLNGKLNDPLFEVSYEADPFSFTVRRSSGPTADGPGRAVFDTQGTRLVFKDQYLELTTWVDGGAFLYGAGERASAQLHLRRNGLPLTIWSHDIGPTFIEQNMYGSHPIVLAVEEDGTAWGALLFNSNGMDVVATEDRLSWRVIGGVIDLFIFMGPTPLDVMDQFTRVVGRPAMMPYWTLGFHQCKYGYKSVWEVEAVVANYSAANIPLDTIWTDIDHMEHWKDFTFDPVNYPVKEMKRFVAKLHKNEQRWVPIVDPGIKVEKGYLPYERGIEQGIFMQGADGKPYLGWVWPGACHFPDFLDPKGQAYFSQLLAEHHDLVPWDGIWIDMDEISNFCTGDVCHFKAGAADNPPPPRALSKFETHLKLGDDPPWVCQLDCSVPSGLSEDQKRMLDPPYQIANYLMRGELGSRTMSVLATHTNGMVQYNSHNLYGLSEIKTTSEAVERIRGKRPFVLSRASFTGLGAYGAHWTGDNAATWNDLAWSIPHVLNIGLFGIPMGGADICGFGGETTPELCARWIALGAFYPFSRDHSDLHGEYQELYRWPVVAKTARRVLGLRYRLLPYLYTSFFEAAQSGAPVMRPLFFNFPKDRETYGNSKQFMVGETLLVSPVLEQGASQVSAYFPPALWYNLWDKADVVDASEGGRTLTLDAPLATIPLHMRGGSVVAMQEGGLTTAQAKRSPLTVVVALPALVAAGANGAQQAQRVAGHMYNDDGESIEVGASPCNFLTFNATVGYNPVGDTHEAQLLMQFGQPGQRPACQVGAADAPRDWEWPALAAVEVWGWRRAVGSARLEVLLPKQGCNELEVVQSAVLASSQVHADGHGLKLDLAPLNLKLECPYALRVSWESSDSAADVVMLSA